MAAKTFLNTKSVAIAAFLLIVVGLILKQDMLKMEKNRKRQVLFSISDPPKSADPFLYDYFIHHEVFRSTFSSLITQYRRGEYVGILAESWASDDNNKIWKFKLRGNILFENGDTIDSDAIVSSLTRIAFLLNKRNSQDGLLSNLVGFNETDSPTAKIKGIIADPTSLTLQFVKPMPQLLELISFGLYSIAHKNDYSSVDGKWKNDRHFVSSGPYKVTSWKESNLVLTLREEYLPGLGHNQKFQEIVIDWVSENDADIISSDDFEPLESSEYQYFGGPRSSIFYMHCLSWANKSSSLSDRQTRIILRDLFYEKFKEFHKMSFSFFPLAIPGIAQLRIDGKAEKKKLGLLKPKIEIATPGRGSISFKKHFSETWQEIGKITSGAITEVQVEFSDLISELNPEKKKHSVDIVPVSTGILIESPDDDIKFMFLSKEGIRLPDETGEIRKLLSNHVLDYQEINKLIWDQAIIWPIGHFSKGILIKDHIDISMLNTLKPPIDFFWLGLK